MGNTQGSISNLTSLLTKDGTEQALLGGQLGLTLGRDLTHQDITGADLGTLLDDTVGIQILECVVTDVGNLAGNLFRPKLGITGFVGVLFNVERSINVKVKPNPWELVGERFPEGTIIEGVIKNITEFGMFIGIEDGIDGLIHVSDISWTKKLRHPGEVYKVGDVVQAKVLTVDQENEKFTLGMKQLAEDPWASVPARYPVGNVITGTVTNVTDFGLFVEVEEGIEGLIHVTELGKKVKSPSELFKEGDSVQAKIIHVSADERRLGLSIKQIKDDEERRKPKDYHSGDNSISQTLGDLLKQKFND